MRSQLEELEIEVGNPKIWSFPNKHCLLKRGDDIIVPSIFKVFTLPCFVSHHISPRTSCDWLETAVVRDLIEYILFGLGAMRDICCIAKENLLSTQTDNSSWNFQQLSTNQRIFFADNEFGLENWQKMPQLSRSIESPSEKTSSVILYSAYVWVKFFKLRYDGVRRAECCFAVLCVCVQSNSTWSFTKLKRYTSRRWIFSSEVTFPKKIKIYKILDNLEYGQSSSICQGSNTN